LNIDDWKKATKIVSHRAHGDHRDFFRAGGVWSNGGRFHLITLLNMMILGTLLTSSTFCF